MRILLSALAFIILASLHGQNVPISPENNGSGLKDFLDKIQVGEGIKIIYDDERLPNITVNNISDPEYLVDYLRKLLSPFGFKFIKHDNTTLIILTEENYNEFGMKSENYLIYTSEKSTTRKQRHRLTGQIVDKGSKNPLPGVQVILPSLGLGTTTDLEGRYELKIPSGLTRIEYRYVGYEPLVYMIHMEKDAAYSHTIEESTRQLEAMVITAQRDDNNIKSNIAGTESMSIESIKSLPTFLGEVDHIKSLTALPGVRSSELASGINVRGGESGQNLILQDETIIVNPSHMFGYFSAFSLDIVNEVKLHKGGGPASLGGRVSSTLEFGLKNGSLNKRAFSGGVGLTSSRLTWEQPIIEDKMSLIVGGRVAYPNWLIKRSQDKDIQDNRANFHDFTLKLHTRLNSRNVINLSGYRSYDDFLFATDSVYNEWSTLNFALQWKSQISSNKTLKVALSKSRYASEVIGENYEGRFKAQTGLSNVRLKASLTNDLTNTLILEYGTESNFYQLSTGDLIPQIEGIGKTIKPDDHKGLENAVYVHSSYEATPKLSLAAGLRFSSFLRLGAGTIYDFDYINLDGNIPGIADSTTYSSGELISSHFTLEPRISFRYLLSPATSLKGSFYRSAQYLHLISNTGSATPQDYYVASSDNLDQQIGNQISLGVFQNLNDNKWEASIEGFYKTTENAIDYIDGSDITQNPKVEQGLYQGIGKAYGLEALIKRNKGKWTGWISYTYARSLRKITPKGELPSINNDEYYPSSFDQPHDLTVVSTYHLSKRASLSMNFNYRTGRPITIPTATYESNGVNHVNIYSERNKYRIPDYHRLDLSMTIKDKDIRNKKIHGEWNFSLYNVYGRKNAYSVYFDERGISRKLYVLGNIFPSVSYNFKF